MDDDLIEWLLANGGPAVRYRTASGKLLELGLRAGMTPLDKSLERFRRWLAEKAAGETHTLSLLHQSICAAGASVPQVDRHVLSHR